MGHITRFHLHDGGCGKFFRLVSITDTLHCPYVILLPATGGIATFSPSVFAECPSSAYRLLDMLVKHPLWDCFVSPGVVALAARQTGGSDPVSEFERWVHVSPLRAQQFNKKHFQGDLDTPRSLVQNWTRTVVFTVHGASSLWPKRGSTPRMDPPAPGNVHA